MKRINRRTRLWLTSCPCNFNQAVDLPPKDAPHLELELCHFLFLNANMPLALEDGNSMNYVA
jgi:hypothetical protein